MPAQEKRPEKPPGNHGILNDLRRAIGEERVCVDPASRTASSRGTWPVEFKWLSAKEARPLPLCVVRPQSTLQVAQVLKIASEYHLTVIPYGGGSGIVGGTIPSQTSIVMDLKALRGYSLSRVNHVVTAGAGWTWAHLEELVARDGFTTGNFPQSVHSATVGGMVATNGIGTFSTKYGKVEDMVVAVEAVLADGTIIQTSLAPKASTGPDLKRLFIGSEGALGVVTQVSLRVWPKPEFRRLEGYAFPGTVQGLQALRAMLQQGLSPAVVRLYDEAESEHFANALGLHEGQALLILGHEGHATLAQMELDLCRPVAESHGGVYLGTKPGDVWLATRFSTERMLRANRKPGHVCDSIEVAAPWDRLEAVWRAMRESVADVCYRIDAHVSHVYPTGGSLYVIFYAQAPNDQQAIPLYGDIVHRLLEASIAAGGNSSHHHGIGTAKVDAFKNELGSSYGLLVRLKDALDPGGILVPGNFGLDSASRTQVVSKLGRARTGEVN